MTVTSFYFLLLLVIGAVIYYIVPKKIQWVVLLLMSLVFYLFSATPYTIVFLIISTLVAYAATSYIAHNRGSDKKNKKISYIAVAGIIVNVIVWFLLKGSSFWILGSKIISRLIPSFPLLSELPWIGALGMGYYSAQVIGYILDVLWGNAEYQKNPIKLFLFVSFFPQLTVGPISRYTDLKCIYEGHKFSYTNLCFGAQRILWGLFKKLVISDRVGIIVDSIWANTDSYFGIWPWIAVLLYPLQIYTDFSGCVDIILGAAEIFDIHLAENFRNPFFSKNCQEFWQRWHITLGGWARDYVFYPFMKSKWMVSFGKKCKKRFNKFWGKLIPWSVSMAVLWFVMGFWHGSVKHIFGVSLWFWTVLFISELTRPITKRVTEILGVKQESFGWHFFQSARTYFIYSLGVVFFTASGLRTAFSHYGVLIRSLRELNPWTLFDGTVLSLGVSWRDVNIIILGVLILTIVDVLRENHNYAREWMKKQSFGFRWIVWIGLFVMVLVYGLYGPGYDASTFIYQGF